MKTIGQALTLIIASFMCSCSGLSLQAAEREHGASLPKQPERTVMCAFDQTTFPDDMLVLAAGAYSGRKTGWQMDQSGHEATQMEVVVNMPGTPVALMLGSHEPTIWNLSWTKGTHIVAVLVSGYYRQALAGIDDHIPVLNSTYANNGACGYFYLTAEKMDRLAPLSLRVFQREVNSVYLAEAGSVVIGEALLTDTPLLTNSALPPESFRDPASPLPGIAGLQQAVQQGVLRVATVADAKRWDAAFMQHPGKVNLPPDATLSPSSEQEVKMHNAYVVLKPFTLPSGLYGEHAATFFVLEGVPRPSGHPGHSAIYDFNTVSCADIRCNPQPE